MNGMTVEELMAKLSKAPPQSKIVIVNSDWEDEGLATETEDGKNHTELNADCFYIQFQHA